MDFQKVFAEVLKLAPEIRIQIAEKLIAEGAYESAAAILGLPPIDHVLMDDGKGNTKILNLDD